MFDLSGFFSCDDAPRSDAVETIEAAAADTAVPVRHMVFKDGAPFVILDATPALAEFTFTGFVQATPQSQWTLARC